MSQTIEMFKVKEFIIKNKIGKIDVEASKRIAQELSISAFYNAHSNFLIDYRSATVLIDELVPSIMIIVDEFLQHKKVFAGRKIASIIPSNDPDRLKYAQEYNALLNDNGGYFQAQYFFSIEEAIQWFSEPQEFRQMLSTARKNWQDADRGLILDGIDLEYICRGLKLWHIKDRNTEFRGVVKLIEKETGHICGIANLVDAFPVSKETLLNNSSKHNKPIEDLDKIESQIHAWVFCEGRFFDRPTHCGQNIKGKEWVKFSSTDKL